MELTNTVRGFRHDSGSDKVDGWTVRPKPGPEVTGWPSFWYFADPMPFNRLAMVRA
jgi:hypothetical protein